MIAAQFEQSGDVVSAREVRTLPNEISLETLLRALLGMEGNEVIRRTLLPRDGEP